ncbi:MAG: hypothetical protein WCA46_28085, partial [Actinocatenispora sp.]
MVSVGSAGGVRAAVLGGSIGGLCAALCLRAAGCEVDVFERSPGQLESRGAGIGMQQSMVDLLTALEIDPGTVGTESHRLRYHRPDGGLDWDQPASGRYTAWNTLYRALLAKFGTERYHLGETIVDLESKEDLAVVGFAGGRRVEADLVVCADGVNSAARGLLVPDAVPRYAGYVAWRALIPERDLPTDLWSVFDDAISYCVLPEARSHVIIYPVPGADGETGRGARRINLVWYWNVPEDELVDLFTDRDGVHRPHSVPAGMVGDRQVARMRADATSLMAPRVAELVCAAREPFLQTIVEVGVPRMVFGRTCLVGDAAFAVRPHAGAATSKAAEDSLA